MTDKLVLKRNYRQGSGSPDYDGEDYHWDGTWGGSWLVERGANPDGWRAHVYAVAHATKLHWRVVLSFNGDGSRSLYAGEPVASGARGRGTRTLAGLAALMQGLDLSAALRRIRRRWFEPTGCVYRKFLGEWVPFCTTLRCEGSWAIDHLPAETDEFLHVSHEGLHRRRWAADLISRSPGGYSAKGIAAPYPRPGWLAFAEHGGGWNYVDDGVDWAERVPAMQTFDTFKPPSEPGNLGHLVAVHADGGSCHGVRLIDGWCPGCHSTPDMQSTALWQPHAARDP